MKLIICFPPFAGGNHVKNIIQVNEENFKEYIKLYTDKEPSQPGVHMHPGHNLTKEKFHKNNIVHGHFGEIMSVREDIRQTVNKKWILISPDTYKCRSILYKRSGVLPLDTYYDHEQVFLYEPHMIHNYFGSKMIDIMNVSIYELFSDNINSVLDRIDSFLPFNINKDQAKDLHKLWKGNM